MSHCFIFMYAFQLFLMTPPCHGYNLSPQVESRDSTTAFLLPIKQPNRISEHRMRKYVFLIFTVMLWSIFILNTLSAIGLWLIAQPPNWLKRFCRYHPVTKNKNQHGMKVQGEKNIPNFTLFFNLNSFLSPMPTATRQSQFIVITHTLPCSLLDELWSWMNIWHNKQSKHKDTLQFIKLKKNVSPELYYFVVIFLPDKLFTRYHLV